MSEDVYATNAPNQFPTPKEQPEIEPEASVPQLKVPPIRETVDRWRKDVIDKIQYLRENLDLALMEKEALSQEVDRLQSDLVFSKERCKELETQLSEALDTFNSLLNEVSTALEK